MIEEKNYIQDEYKERDLNKRTQLLKEILGISENKINSSTIDYIKKATCKYYELTQFKRAYFDCTEMTYDKSTGRINNMVFKIETDANGKIIFN